MFLRLETVTLVRALEPLRQWIRASELELARERFELPRSLLNDFTSAAKRLSGPTARATCDVIQRTNSTIAYLSSRISSALETFMRLSGLQTNPQPPGYLIGDTVRTLASLLTGTNIREGGPACTGARFGYLWDMVNSAPPPRHRQGGQENPNCDSSWNKELHVCARQPRRYSFSGSWYLGYEDETTAEEYTTCFTNATTIG